MPYDPPPLAARPRACLVLHGLGGGPYEVEPLIEALKDVVKGPVSAPVLPGHDGPGPVMPASRWEDWAAAAESAYDDLVAENGPTAVLGFSTGATLALNLASTGRSPAGLVLLAPFLAIRFSGLLPVSPAGYLRQLAKLRPDIPRRPPAVRDRESRRWVVSKSRFKTFNLHCAVSALELIDRVAPRVPSIVTPTLILQGARDSVVEPGKARWLEAALGSPWKRLVWSRHSDHLLALDRDRDQVARDVLEFISGNSD